MIDLDMGTRQQNAKTAKKTSSYGKGATIFVLFAAVALIAYFKILNDTPVADDFGHLTRVSIIPATQLWKLVKLQSPLFMRPLPFLQIWVFYRLFGLDWLPSHIVNVLMHATAAFAAFWLLKKIGAGALAAFSVAGLFLLTPLATEAVTWTAGRFDVWCVLFLVLSLGLYVTAIQKKSQRAYLGSLVFALAALFSKETAMILVILFPALELLFVFYPARLSEWKKIINSDGFRRAIFRLLIFFVVFSAYIALRYVIMGRLGNYRNASYFGVPNVKISIKTLLALLAPLDALEVSRAAIQALRIYTGALLAVSIIIVLFRWRRGTDGARRAWLFSAVFFASSLLVVFPSAFITGLNNSLGDSRYFYTPILGLYGIMAVGLLEFGWRKRIWQICSVLAIALLVPAFIWGIDKNNQAWRYAASINQRITDETYQILPDPPANSKIYFDYIPKAWGGHILANGAKEALRLKYDRTDISIQYAYPLMVNTHGISTHRINNTDDGFLFAFDWKTERIVLIHSPKN